MSFAMLKTWIMVNVYSFLSSFITYIANVMIFFDCKQLCRCTFLLFNILDLLANIYSLSIHPIRDKKTIYILLEHLLYITWAFLICYLGKYYYWGWLEAIIGVYITLSAPVVLLNILDVLWSRCG